MLTVPAILEAAGYLLLFALCAFDKYQIDLGN